MNTEKKYRVRGTKMMCPLSERVEGLFWHQYHALGRVECNPDYVKTREQKIELYKHFINKLFRVNDKLYIFSTSLFGEVDRHLQKVFLDDQPYWEEE